LHERQACSMVDPGAAVHEWHAAHPVGVVIDNEQIAQGWPAAQESQADMMKISGADERKRRRVVSRAAKKRGQAAFKAAISSEAAGQANGGRPVRGREDTRLMLLEQRALAQEAAVEVENADVHGSSLLRRLGQRIALPGFEHSFEVR